MNNLVSLFYHQHYNKLVFLYGVIIALGCENFSVIIALCCRIQSTLAFLCITIVCRTVCVKHITYDMNFFRTIAIIFVVQ